MEVGTLQNFAGISGGDQRGENGARFGRVDAAAASRGGSGGHR